MEKSTYRVAEPLVATKKWFSVLAAQISFSGFSVLGFLVPLLKKINGFIFGHWWLDQCFSGFHQSFPMNFQVCHHQSSQTISKLNINLLVQLVLIQVNFIFRVNSKIFPRLKKIKVLSISMHQQTVQKLVVLLVEIRLLVGVARLDQTRGNNT